MFGQQIALKLEVVARRAINMKESGGLGGVIDADYIQKQRGGFTVICAALSPYYLHASPEARKVLNDFIEKYTYLQECPSETYFKGIERAAEELREILDHLGVHKSIE
ncbi:hypothetical protein DS031_00770 [Bacillus taeanensis]|uniref:Uncharacterized protein n=2 Tax=Bacillus taeanensis TaxID=273032 RepID=A0A366XZF9_9BACI|nr:hypothetical protein DS031_00770 [Bacillus taeanensis]